MCSSRVRPHEPGRSTRSSWRGPRWPTRARGECRRRGAADRLSGTKSAAETDRHGDGCGDRNRPPDERRPATSRAQPGAAAAAAAAVARSATPGRRSTTSTSRRARTGERVAGRRHLSGPAGALRLLGLRGRRGRSLARSGPAARGGADLRRAGRSDEVALPARPATTRSATHRRCPPRRQGPHVRPPLDAAAILFGQLELQGQAAMLDHAVVRAGARRVDARTPRRGRPRPRRP